MASYNKLIEMQNDLPEVQVATGPRIIWSIHSLINL